MTKQNRYSNVGAEETRRKLQHKQLTVLRRSKRRNHRRRLRDWAIDLLPYCWVGLASCFVISLAHGADVSGVDAVPDIDPLQPLLDAAASKYGWVMKVVVVIGSLRIVFKPLMLAIENFVKQTASPTADAKLAKFEAGPIYKAICVALDLGASIKLPLVAQATQTADRQKSEGN